MKNTRKPLRALCALVLASALQVSFTARADMRLASDWLEDWSNLKNPTESEKLNKSVIAEAQRLAATPVDSKVTYVEPALPFQLYFDSRKYYINPVRFMAKDSPGEVCSPARFKGTPTYQCEEGQYYKDSCHLMFFNTEFESVGVQRIPINEPFPVWCNAVPAVGVYDKKKNELLVTFQYFPIDRKAASKISEVGSGWIRMTSLFRLKEENGRILVEQDDSCLKNPNRIESIPDAKKALKRCNKAP